MAADDDGFVQIKSVMRVMGAMEEDARLLFDRGLLLLMKDGVVVIRDWLIHNEIRQDRYKPTYYLEYKHSLGVSANKQYYVLDDNYGEKQLVVPNDNQMATQVRLGKDRLGKERGRTTLTQDQLKEISTNLRVAETYVVSTYEKIKDYELAKGKPYKDVAAAIRYWARNDIAKGVIKREVPNDFKKYEVNSDGLARLAEIRTKAGI